MVYRMYIHNPQPSRIKKTFDSWELTLNIERKRRDRRERERERTIVLLKIVRERWDITMPPPSTKRKKGGHYKSQLCSLSEK